MKYQKRMIMWKRMTSVRVLLTIFSSVLILTTAAVMAITFTSCLLSEEDNTPEEFRLNNDTGDLYLFDYTKIKIQPTSSIDVKIDSCNLYLDLYGDLILSGEVNNNSDITKTDMEITYSFLNQKGQEIHNTSTRALVNYLRMGAKMPFVLYFEEREMYIDIAEIRVGINYKNYNPRFDGNPVVLNENYYYQKGTLFIKGKVINLGKERIKNLRLYCTFYDKKERVVFIKKCNLARERMMPEEQQEFVLEIIPDEYLEKFDSYHFEVFFEDEIEVSA